MMEWFIYYSTGFMCVGRKPHLFLNERHAISCGLLSILWREEIIEGKYCPSHRGQNSFKNLERRLD